MLAILLATGSLAGCGALKVPIDPVRTSLIPFSALRPEATDGVDVVDARTEVPEFFGSGRANIVIRLDGEEVDPVELLREQVAREMQARGLGDRIGSTGSVELEVQTFKSVNHQFSGYSPFVTFTLLGGRLRTPTGSEPLCVFVKRGKVLVLSVTEAFEPNFQEPIGVLVREVVAKVNRSYYGGRLADDHVQSLIGAIGSGPATRDTWLDIYELGFSNNPNAAPAIARLTDHGEEYSRLAAISSLGTLRATEHRPLLGEIHRGARMWQDRAMALKAIGDLGTPEAYAYLRAERDRLENESGMETEWTLEIFDLYLNALESD